jgi:uncharacterized protein
VATTSPPTLPPVGGDGYPASPGQPSRPRRRRPARSRVEGERRLWSAGHALVVCLLALVIGALLNAPGIHKSAYNQPDGWKRDVALAFTGPLETVSHALLLDRPRAGVQALIGRSGIDEIDTEIAIDGEAAGPPAGQPAPPPTSATPPAQPPARKVKLTPKRPLRVWIAGDSLVIIPGFAIQRATAGNRAIVQAGEMEGQVASGLTRPDVFNWFEHIRSQLRELKPRAIVLAFGANDTNDYMTGLPDGVSVGSFGSAAWVQEYRRRVAGVFDMVNRAGAHVVWLGLPVTTDARQSERFGIVNAAVAAEARERPKTVSFIDTYLLLAGPDGGYAEYLTTPGGGQIKVRAPDGVHIERAGGDIVAREVLEALGEAYDLTSWKKRAAG